MTHVALRHCEGALIAVAPPLSRGSRGPAVDRFQPMLNKRLAAFNSGSPLARVPGQATRKFRKDEVIFAQGEPADSVYYIQNGKAKVTVVSSQGKEAVVAIVGPGDFVGEGCLGGEKKRVSTIVALEECTVARYDRSAMLRALADEPVLAGWFIGYLLDRIARIEENLVDQLFNSSEKRLARLLLILTDFGTDESTQLLTTRISQETLAEMVGTTRARVSFFMNKFRRLGFIEYDGQIKVHRPLLATVLED